MNIEFVLVQLLPFYLQYVQAKRGMCVESTDSGYKSYEEPEIFIWPDETSVLCIQ